MNALSGVRVTVSEKNNYRHYEREEEEKRGQMMKEKLHFRQEIECLKAETVQ